MSKTKDWLMDMQNKEMEDLDLKYREHDCHASPEDGCEVCEAVKKAHEQPEPECSEGICDGSGYIMVGEYDDIREERCVCNPKVSMEELMDDDS